MKIVFFGTPQFAVPSLEKLAKSKDFEVLVVITQEDKPVGRKQSITPPPVKIKAQELGLKVLQPRNSKELEKELSGYTADFFVVMAYGEIMSKKILDMPKCGAINVHTSLLPKYRGASPIQESLLNGDEETGISIMRMDTKMDHGSIYLIKRVKIEDNDTLETLTTRLSEASGYILPLILKDIFEKRLSPIPQDDKKATYCRKIKKEDGEVNLKKQTAAEIKNMIRAYTPWPSVFVKIKGKKIKILETDISKEDIPAGKFLTEGKTLKIGTKQGILVPKKLQPEGKNSMETAAFINGYKDLFLTSD